MQYEKILQDYYRNNQKYLRTLNKHRDEYFEVYHNLILPLIKESKVIIELGCGDGYSTFILSKELPKSALMGIDISPLFISFAKKTFKNRNLSYKIQSIIDSVPKHQVQSADAIIAIEFIEHVPNIKIALDNMIRMLKRKGLLIILSPNILSPILPIKNILNFETTIPYTETWSQNFSWLIKNIVLLAKKKLQKEASFTYMIPDLTDEKMVGGDTDAVYCANPIDLEKYLRKRYLEIINITLGGNKVINKICPSWHSIAIVARKK